MDDKRKFEQLLKKYPIINTYDLIPITIKIPVNISKHVSTRQYTDIKYETVHFI